MRFKQVLLFLFLLLIPLLVGAYSPDAVRIGRDFATSFTEPFVGASSRLQSWLHAQKDFLIQIFHAREENERLNSKILELKRMIADLREEKEENARLKKLLQFQKTTQQKTISAQVIARDISHWTYYAVINKGAKDGVLPDIPAVTGEGLVGKVAGVSPHSARVILLIDSESRVSAMVQETRDVGLIEGTGGSFLRMTYLDVRAQIQVGQTVISSGYGDLYPKGIPIGQIVEIREDKNGLSLEADVKPFVSFSKLEEMLCLIPEKREQS